MITHYVSDYKTKEILFEGTYDECTKYCETNEPDWEKRFGSERRYSFGYYTNEQIETHPKNQDILNKKEVLGIDIVSIWSCRDNIALLSKDGVVYHIKHDELVSAIQSHHTFKIEKKRVRRWLHP